MCTLRKLNRKLCGYSRCDRGFFNKCVACNLIPTNGIKTHQCNKTKETFEIDSPVNCVITNVIYRIDAVGSWQKILPMPNLERAY